MSKRSESILSLVIVLDIIYVLTETFQFLTILPNLIAYSKGNASYLFDANSIQFLQLKTAFYIIGVLFLAIFIIKWVKLYKHYKVVSRYRQQLYAEKLADFYKKPILTDLFITDPSFSIDKFLIRAKRMYIAFIHNLAQDNFTALQLLLSPQRYDQYLSSSPHTQHTLTSNQASASKSILASAHNMTPESALFSNHSIVSKSTTLSKHSLNSKRAQKKIMERVFIQHIHIHDYYEESDTAYLTVGMLVETRKLSKRRLQPKEIKKCMLTFSRNHSAKTKSNSDLFDTEHCPNCGAPLVISLKGDCDYCGEHISSGKFAWCIHHIEDEFIERLDYGIGDW